VSSGVAILPQVALTQLGPPLLGLHLTAPKLTCIVALARNSIVVAGSVAPGLVGVAVVLCVSVVKPDGITNSPSVSVAIHHCHANVHTPPRRAGGPHQLLPNFTKAARWDRCWL
jgi:hypothetical protein